ncbi:MAG: M48 family metalloprotease [Bacteroidales bacterium]|jgi:Zn-dependent protease with chaperone function|nr:M48 family metalloprotease [Bacteroidales bacterium]
MKKTAILLIIMLLSASGVASGQIPVSLKGKNRATGEVITINFVIRPLGRLSVQTVPDPVTGKIETILYSELRKYDIVPTDIESLWQVKMLESQTYDGLLKSGYSYDLRYAMEEMMREFMSRADQNNLFYIDSYLEARLYGLLRMVYPVRNSDKRPGIISLRILSDIVPDAWVGPDGTMIITTGMITAVNSEIELMALMAQEVAHFALDHHLSNYNNLLLTMTEPALGNLIRYTTKQELVADACAVSVLKLYGRDPSVLASMLRKVLAAGELMGNYYLGSTNGFFPDAASRSWAYQDTLVWFSAEYEKMIAPVISYNAFSAYSQSQYLLCLRLLERNIASGVATPDDLVLLSQAMMNLSGSDQEDENALAVVRSVTETMQEPSPAAFKQEALLLLRLGRRGEAEKALGRCDEALDREEQKYRAMTGDWSQMLSYLASEKEWVARTKRR